MYEIVWQKTNKHYISRKVMCQNDLTIKVHCKGDALSRTGDCQHD